MREQDLARIAFVTARFSDLQGLRTAALGAAVVISVVASTMAPTDFGDPLTQIVLPVQNATYALAIGLNGYYSRCFGRVPATGHHRRNSRPSWDLAAGAAPYAIMLGMSVDFLKGFFYPGGVSYGAVAVAGFSAWIVWRDWPHRVHHVIAVFAGAVGIAISSSIPIAHRVFGNPLDPIVASHLVLTYALLGLGVFAVGLLDHRLLAAAMAPTSSPPLRAPDRAMSRFRAAFAGGCLAVIATFLAIAGWPQDAAGLYLTFYVGTSVVAVAVLVIYMVVVLSSNFRTFDADLAERREARLLAQMAGIRSEKPSPETEVPPRLLGVPHFESLGHFVLPFAVACGAVIDIGTRGSGLPSLLALALAASHLRIALRDWPSRKHYLLGALAASISAIHFMFVTEPRILDWTVWFLILTCGAMLVEGLLDLRLARTARLDNFSKEHHADAI